jgi:hypothetical protein
MYQSSSRAAADWLSVFRSSDLKAISFSVRRDNLHYEVGQLRRLDDILTSGHFPKLSRILVRLDDDLCQYYRYGRWGPEDDQPFKLEHYLHYLDILRDTFPQARARGILEVEYMRREGRWPCFPR